MNKLKIFIIAILGIFSIIFLNVNTFAFNLKDLRAKLQAKEDRPQVKKIIEKKQQNDKKDNYLKFKSIEIDKNFYKIYKEEVNEKLKLYNQYLQEKNKEKKKALEAKYSYLKILKRQIQEIKKLISKNKFLYMWSLYLPVNSNLIFFKFNEKLYFLPAFTTKIETKSNLSDINKYVDNKYKLLKDKYKESQINIIKSKKEFDLLNKQFWLINFNTVKNNLNIFSDTDINVIMYPNIAVKTALKEEGIDYKTKWIFTFFILNNYNDIVAYKAHYLKSTIKLVSDYFMNVWQNNIWINWYTNNIGYKEILLPLKVIKQQKITVIKPKSLSFIDIIIFIAIILLGWWIIYLWLKKMFNIYNDID